MIQHPLTAYGAQASWWAKNPPRRPPGCVSFKEIAEQMSKPGARKTVATVAKMAAAAGVPVKRMNGARFIAKQDLPRLLVANPAAAVAARRRG